MSFVIKTWIKKGSYNNNEITVWVKDGIKAGLDEYGFWNKSGTDDLIFTAPFVPPREWLISNTRRIFEYALANNVPDALTSWKDAAALLSQLPRVIMPDAMELSGRLSAVCSAGDMRMREILKGLGFRWSPQGRVWSLKATEQTCRDAAAILSHWNADRSPASFAGTDIFSFCKIPLTNDQEDTLRYLIRRWEQGWHGSVNGDDMGIGKTYGSLILGALALETGAATKIVVVAKTSNIAHWKAEWADKILRGSEGDVCIFGAARVTSAKNRKKGGGIEELENEMAHAKVLITNYEYLNTNSQALSMFLKYCSGSVVFFDEAVSMCANHMSGVSKAAFKVSCMANFAVPLSGTLEKKNIYEFWSVLHLADPVIYPEKEFNENHCVLETKKLWLKAQKRSIEIQSKKYIGEEAFLEHIAPAYIRHMKKIPEVLSRKEEYHFRISREDSYLENKIADGLWERLCSIKGAGKTWEELAAEGARLPKWQMTALTHLHSALDDPYTLFQSEIYKKFIECADTLALDIGADRKAAFDYLEERISDKKNNQYNELFSPDVVEFARFMENLDSTKLEIYKPAKFRFLSRMLDCDYPDSRVVVFSVFKRTAERLADMLREQYPYRPVYLISGEVPKAKRTEIENECRSHDSSILITTDSMAFGTNLQFMDVLVNYNLPWTCDILKQRNDRIYRTGAKGLKNIVYITIDSPVERHKLNILQRGIDKVRNHFGEDISDIPYPEDISIEEYMGMHKVHLQGEKEYPYEAEVPVVYGQSVLFEEPELVR